MSEVSKRTTVEQWGNRWLIKCSCGYEDYGATSKTEARQYQREHRRYGHPTEDEAVTDSLREAESEYGGCERCGHDDHTGSECPNVQPWMLKKIPGYRG